MRRFGIFELRIAKEFERNREMINIKKLKKWLIVCAAGVMNFCAHGEWYSHYFYDSEQNLIYTIGSVDIYTGTAEASVSFNTNPMYHPDQYNQEDLCIKGYIDAFCYYDECGRVYWPEVDLDVTTLTPLHVFAEVKRIGGGFSECRGLKSVTVPETVENIGSRAFAGCELLESVVILKNDGHIYIEKEAFADCKTLKDITFRNEYGSRTSRTGCVYLYDEVFARCRSLECIYIEGNIYFTEPYHDSVSPFDECSSFTEFYVYDNDHLSVRNDLLCDKTGTVVWYCPNGLTNAVIPDGATRIASSAFKGCCGLTSMTIPNSVTNIGASAFSGCNGLTSVTIPDSVIGIGDSAFYGCSSLASITIPDSVTSIGSYAFRGCSSLTSVMIPDSVTSIGKWAFSGCSSLASVMIPDSVTSIGAWAFEGCSLLTSVTIPDSVTSIGSCAFYGCSSLTSMTIPDSVTSIGYNAFSGCSSLTSVTIPDSVTSIGNNAFEYCRSLNEVHITDLAKWCDISFENSESNPLCYSHNLYLNGERIVNLVIPENVTNISAYAFSGCSSLTSVTIPDSVTSIAEGTFSGCSGFASITIPDSVTSIGSSAFSGCNSLVQFQISENSQYYSIRNGLLCNKSGTRVILCPPGLKEAEIPIGITEIESGAFSSCDSLKSVTMPAGLLSDGYEITSDWQRTQSGNTCEYEYTSIGNFSSTSMSLVLVGPCEFSFEWKVSGDKNYDWLNWSLDGVWQDEISDTGGDWRTVTCSIPKGVHTIEWWFSRFSKYGPTDYAWVRIYGGNTVHNLLGRACDNITNVVLTANASKINDFAFEYCSSLRSVTIPDSVTSIGSNAFSGCSSLTSVTFMGDVPSGIGNSDILDYATKVYYPEKYAAAYEAIVLASQFGGYVNEDGTVGIVSEINYTGLQGATHTNAATYVEGVGIAAFAEPTDINGYTFIGWAPMSISADATGPQTITAQWRRDELSVPVISAPSVFETPSCTVTISAEEGAAIYYTLDGSIPTAASVRYTAPIVLTETATVKAIAVREDYFDSPVASCSVTRRIKTLGECVNSGTFSFTTGGDAEWVRAYGESADGFALRSGDITHSQTSRLDMVVRGAGVITFMCRVEGEIIRNIVFDGLAFCIDGVPQGTLIGDSSWTRKSFSITGPGEHTLSWRYVKDYEGDGAGADCAWLDCVVWESVAEVIPEVKDDSEVEAVLKESADAKLVENIKDATEYNAYREWAAKLPDVTPQQVKESPQAWLSYALDADTLIAEAPKTEDVKIDEFRAETSTPGEFNLSVSVENVTIGENAKTENLAKVFGIEGATSLDGNGFSSENVGIEFGKPVDGKVKLKATPKDKSVKSFFMRVKVK